ncbi:MAG TPA: FAD-dependent oxidoreductase, partial [Candidatus Lustribacter sp.]|nr:FAD-dependent oxidoreductase [Candidatus Lustribacter sp.]
MRILILGAGFAGVATARALERRLRPGEAEIAIVGRDNFSLFTPMLPEVSAGGLETRHVVTPVRAELRRARFVLGDVTAIDLEARRVEVAHSITGARQTLAYDQLVLALGSVTSTFGIPGVAEHALPLKTLEDADRLRNRAIASLELADVTSDPAERARLLTFVIVGGGYTGVEGAGEWIDLFHSVTPFYPTIARGDVRIVLIEAGPVLLAGL